MTPPKKKHTLSALVENKFGVLARVAGMLSGRGFNIETLNVGPTHDPAYSRITATVVADDAALDRCVKALDKLINVITVNDFSREEVDHVARELILVKVKSDKKTRTEILENVWDEHWYGPTKTVDAHVASIRKKLGANGWIEAVRGVGFRLEPPA